MRGLVYLLAAATLAAAPHRYRDHPNASILIHSIAEDPRGFFWLAAADGLYRFDGLHYQKFPGAPFSSIRYVGVTADGALWIAGPKGMARYRGQEFHVVERGEITGFAVSTDTVFFAVQGRVHRIHQEGHVTRMGQKARGDLLVANSALWLIDDRHACGVPFDALDADGLCPLNVDISDYYVQAAPDQTGVRWCADRRQAVPCANPAGFALDRHSNPVVWRSGPLLPGRNGQLWFLGETVRGLSPRVEFLPAAAERQFLPTAGLEDQKGHLWVALSGKGLREWIPDPEWERWHSEDFGNEPVSQVLRTRQSEWLAATHGDLYRLDEATSRWKPLHAAAKHFYHVSKLGEDTLLASVRGLGLVRLSLEGRLLGSYSHPLGSPDRFRKSFPIGADRTFIGGLLGLFLLEKTGSTYHLRTLDLPGTGSDARALEVFWSPPDRTWIGYSGGIGFFDGDLKWRPLAVDRPLRHINSFAIDDRSIWVSHGDRGAFARLDLRGLTWHVTDLLPKDGYAGETTFVAFERGERWLWRGTSDGVYIANADHTAAADWLHLNEGNGLPVINTAPYGLAATGDNSLAIAGIEGAARFGPDRSWFAAPEDAPPPWISRMQVDGREFFGPDALPRVMPASTKSVLVEIGSFDSPVFRQHPFRYRLQSSGAEWRLSKDGVIRFDALTGGTHRLEVAYTGEGPSRVLTYEFQILVSSRWWIWPTAISLVAGIAAILFRAPQLEGLWYAISKTLFAGWRRFRPVHGTSGPTDLSGQVVGPRYRLIRRVSAGGFSTVYEGRDEESNERVAVKVLNLPPGKRSWIRQRFAFEVAALQSIDHPSVVSILDWWASPSGAPALAMPFVEGPTLRRVLADGPLVPERAAQVVRQLGSALAAVHVRGVVHRDLKPENVILAKDSGGREKAVIVDFGTAGLRGPSGDETVTSLFAGSPEYMAPERMTGHYSPATDAYSLGVMALELITSRRLSSFESHVPGSEFFGELSYALEAALGSKARQLASVLIASLDPDPKRRPTALSDWSELVAQLMERQ